MIKLREKHERFVQEYLVDLNATQAAIRAGYSAKSASQQGSELLSNPKVRARVDELMAERSRRTGVNQDRVIRELARVAFINAPDVIDMLDATLRQDAGADNTAAIASVRVKIIPTSDGEGVEREIRLCDKLKALELLGKHMAMFTDRVQLDVDQKVVIVDDIPESTE